MNDDIKFILDSTQEAMDMAIRHLEKQFANIRAGKATPAMLGSVMVNYYGAQTPLSQVANVNTPDGRTITVQPWEKKMLQEIERGIQIANLGFNPMNNGDVIIINVSEALQKNAEVDVQHLTDKYVKKIDDILEVKEKEIMTV